MKDMHSDKKDLDAILATLDPKLREKIELPKQNRKADYTGTETEKHDNQAHDIISETVTETATERVSEYIPEPQAEAPKSKLDEALSALDPKLRSAVMGEGSEKVDKSDELNEAEQKAAAILNFDSSISSGKPKSSSVYLGVEIIILEVIAFFLFFVTFHSETLGGISIFAMLLPAIFGILYRMFRHQISFKDAVMKCRLHIGISCLFLVCVMLSV